MKTIHKYPIAITDSQEIQMPGGAYVIHAGLDPKDIPCVWAIVETDQPIEAKKILVVGTGHPLPFWHGHVGSFVDESYVWHVFAP